MPAIEELPTELICQIADMCTFGVIPERDQCPTAYAKYHSRLARTSRHLYGILNPTLYRRNINKDPLIDSCVLWAARRGQLETIKIAHRLGARIDIDGATIKAHVAKPDWHVSGDWAYPGYYSNPRRLKTPLHLAIKHGHCHILEYLLENEVNIHEPAQQVCEYQTYSNNQPCPSLPYPLHTALSHSVGFEKAEQMLIKRGAYLIAEGRLAFPIVAQKDREDLMDLLLELEEPRTTSAAFLHAVKTQKLGLFRRALDHPELDYTISDSAGRTALHFAAQQGGLIYAKPLLERLSRADITDSSLITPLHYAAARGDVVLVEQLLERPEVDANVVDRDGMTPLHYAVTWRRKEVVEFLLNRPEVVAGAQDSMDRTPLHLAAASGSSEVVMMFLPCRGVDVKDTDDVGSTVLHYVSQAKGDTDDMVFLVGLFIRMGVPVDAVSRTEVTALHQAAKHHNFETALALLAHDADPLVRRLNSFGSEAPWTILHHCLYGSGTKQTELITRLISLGVDIETKTTEIRDETVVGPATTCGPPLVFSAVYSNNTECMRLLLEAGADANCTALFSDWGYGDTDFQDEDEDEAEEHILSLIFRHGYPTRDRTAENHEKYYERLCLLLQYGSSLEGNGHGKTPLEWACFHAIERGHFDILQSIVRNASRANISIEYLKEQIEDYEKDDGNIGSYRWSRTEPIFEDQMVWVEEAFQLLKKLKDRIYPEPEELCEGLPRRLYDSSELSQEDGPDDEDDASDRMTSEDAED